MLTDERGIGKQIADTSSRYGVDILNTLFLTPLPGTLLWKDMESQGRIAANLISRKYGVEFTSANCLA